MFYIIGIITVFGSVVLGYTMHGGSLMVLNQPNEFIIILGAAIGSVIIGYPIAKLKKALVGLKYLFKGKPYNKKDYLELLLFSFNTYKLMKIKGMLEIESHIENPGESELYKLAPSIKKEPFIINFITDNLRIMSMGMDNPHQLDDVMEKEIDLYRGSCAAPGDVYANLGDSLPALGIVAAVLGVIITMRSIMEPPDVLGALIGAALVGTFFGVLMAYGVFGPMGHFLHIYGDYKVKFAECSKMGFIAYLNGNPPIIVVEFMRKNIPEDLRPSFDELDTYINENSMKIMG
ncbi:MAG: flagellar motor stator protein MotA [Rickettsiales bacterium]|nr:MAG: flagellar motor stator protein MotA [Rickettsiales bacterium]